jgi:hypothetical protein
VAPASSLRSHVDAAGEPPAVAIAAIASIGRNGRMNEHPTAANGRTREELLNVVDRLIAEFPDQPAGVVIAQVVRARESRRRGWGLSRPDVVMDVERAARERILTAMPA